MRTYRNFHQQEDHADRVKAARPKVDTGLSSIESSVQHSTIGMSSKPKSKTVGKAANSMAHAKTRNFGRSAKRTADERQENLQTKKLMSNQKLTDNLKVKSLQTIHSQFAKEDRTQSQAILFGSDRYDANAASTIDYRNLPTEGNENAYDALAKGSDSKQSSMKAAMSSNSVLIRNRPNLFVDQLLMEKRNNKLKITREDFLKIQDP